MADTYQAAVEVVADAVRQIMRDREVEVGEITDATALFAYEEGVVTELDLDSMDALDVVAIVEEHFDVELPDDLDFEAIRTVGDVARIISDLVSRRAVTP